MSILSLTHQAELERECAIALLNSLLRPPGSKGVLAGDLGYSRVYLSMLRSIDSASHPRMEPRPFTEAFLTRITQIPWPPEVREQLVHHICRSISLRQEAYRPPPLLPEVGEEEVWAIRRAHDEAQNRAAPAEAKRLFHSVRVASEALLPRLDRAYRTIEYLEVLMCLNDVLSAAGAHTQALYCALQARDILDEIDVRRHLDLRERLLYMASNVLRAVGIPYRNLGFPRKAYACYEEGEARLDRSGLSTTLQQHFASDKLSALGELDRFSIAQAEALAARGIETSPPEARPYRSVILGFRLGCCYMRRGNLRKAQRLFESLTPADGLFENFRPRYRMRFYRDLATLAARLGDDGSWQKWMSIGLALAEEAGLARDYASLLTDHHERVSRLGVDIWATPALEGNVTYTAIQERLLSEGIGLR